MKLKIIIPIFLILLILPLTLGANGAGRSKWYCQNGSNSWKTLFDTGMGGSPTDSRQYIYEEAVIWNNTIKNNIAYPISSVNNVFSKGDNITFSVQAVDSLGGTSNYTNATSTGTTTKLLQGYNGGHTWYVNSYTGMSSYTDTNTKTEGAASQYLSATPNQPAGLSYAGTQADGGNYNTTGAVACFDIYFGSNYADGKFKANIENFGAVIKTSYPITGIIGNTWQTYCINKGTDDWSNVYYFYLLDNENNLNTPFSYYIDNFRINYTATTSQIITIGNTVPTMVSSRFNPNTSVYRNTNIQELCTANDIDFDVINYNYTLYQNSTIIYNNVTNYTPYNISCYQESANISNQIGTDGSCGLKYTGSYSSYSTNGFASSGNVGVSAAYDGSWASGAWANGAGQYAYINITYTKPSAAINAIWRIKPTSLSTFDLNITDTCWNYSLNNLSLMWENYESNINISAYCWNGSWQKLFTFNTSNTYLAEEAIIWNISSSLNIEQTVYSLTNISKGNNLTLQCQAYDGTNYSFQLNSTVLTISDSPPTTQTNISPSVAYYNTNVTGLCSASDVDGDNITQLNYIWYKNNINVLNGSIINNFNNTWYNLTNYTGTKVKNDIIIFSCSGTSNGLNGSYTNSTNLIISATPPYINATINNTIARYNDTLLGYCNYSDYDLGNITTLTFNWYKNNNLIKSNQMLNWISKEGVNLPTYTYYIFSPSVVYNFSNNSLWTMFIQAGNGGPYGYTWNGNTWSKISDPGTCTITCGLSGDGATNQILFNFSGNNKWTALIGSTTTGLSIQEWNGSLWTTNNSLSNGITGNSIYSTMLYNFSNNNKWTLIGGILGSGSFYGYTWNGSLWLADTNITQGLTSISSDTAYPFVAYNIPSIGYNVLNDSKWVLIQGTAGRYYSYSWNGTYWINNNAIISNLPIYNDELTHSPNIVYGFNGTNLWSMFTGYADAAPNRYGHVVRYETTNFGINGQYNNTLSNSFIKNDIIKLGCNITSSYSQNNAYSNNLTISNSNPIIISSKFSPTIAYRNTTINALCNASDGDNDILIYNYSLYINNNLSYSINLLNINTSTGLCYQESADVNNQVGTDTQGCGLNYSGISLLGSDQFYYVNYTKPLSAINGIWKVKHGSSSEYNISIPISCWNYSNTKLLFRIYSNWVPASSYPQCYNGTWMNIGNIYSGGSTGGLLGSSPNKIDDGDWNTFNSYSSPWRYNSGAGGEDAIYDEAMYWNITSNFTITNITKGNNLTLQCQAYDGTGYSSQLNSTQLTINNMPPVVTLSNITPQKAYTDDTLQGLCVVTDIDNDNVTQYNYTWYKNNAQLQKSYVVGLYTLNTQNNVANYSNYTLLNRRDNITFECQAFDGTNYSNILNSTNVSLYGVMKIYAKNNLNNSQLIGINSTVVGTFYGTQQFNDSLTPGIIYTNVHEDLNETVNITVEKPLYYLPNSSYGFNSTNDLNISLYQSIINFTAYDYDNSQYHTNYSVYLEGQFICNATGIGCLGYRNAGNYTNVSIYSIGNTFYNSTNNNLTINPIDIKDSNTNVDIKINVTFMIRDAYNLNNLSGLNVSLNGTYVCASNGNNCSYIPNSIGTYNIFIKPTLGNYQNANETKTFNHTQYQTYILNSFPTLNFKFYDELTLEPFNLSAITGAAMNINILCPTQTLSYPVSVNASNVSINSSCYLSSLKIDIRYGTSSYFRDLYYPNYENIDFTNLPIYLINPYTANPINVDLVPDDTLSEYPNIALIVNKYIGNQSIRITGGLTDLTGKVTTYLMQNAKYNIDLYSNGVFIRNMGEYIANSAGVLPIRLYDITFGSQPQGVDTITYRIKKDNSTYSGSTYVIATYDSPQNDTTRVEFSVYEESLSGNRVNYQVSDADNIQFMFNMTPYSDTYLLCLLNITAHGENIPYVVQCNDITAVGLNVLDYINFQVVNWFLVILITVLALYSTSQTSDSVNFVIIGLAALMNYFGWSLLSGGLLAVAAIFVLVTYLSKSNKDEI